MTEAKNKYVQDGSLRGPDELGSSEGIPADWHVDFNRGSHFVCVQFGSIGFPREAAERLAANILAGLNGEKDD